MPCDFDVVIAGGGIIGSACAFFLARDPNFKGTIAVIEPDPGYQYSATSLSASSIRQQFSTPINIAMSQFGMEFLREASTNLVVHDCNPDIGLIESSYLYLATESGHKTLHENIAIQQKQGVSVKLCKKNELRLRFPWLNVTDVVSGSITDNGEGWFDGYQLLMALRKNARALNVNNIRARVEDISLSDCGQVSGVTLSDNTHIECAYLINAAGTHGRNLSAKVGIEIPVYPRKRCVFVFDCKSKLKKCPLIIDPSGLWFRPEGKQFICSLPPEPDSDVELDDFDVDHNLFEEQIWPLLANRVPDFSTIKVTNFWAGHYDYNTFDQNAIVGPHPVVTNFIHANGFSGHGLQQAPAIGRGISEYITYGQYHTLDLSPLSFNRLIENIPLFESNII